MARDGTGSTIAFGKVGEKLLQSMNAYAMKNIVGIIPAAGRGKRLAPLPLSKEILPLGFWPESSPGGSRPKVASHYLTEYMRCAGICQVYVAIAPGKADIVNSLGEGRELGVELVYRVVEDSPGTPFTVDSLYSFVSGKVCALGFPDIILSVDDVYSALLRRLQEGGAQVVLGLFPAEQPAQVDMIDFDEAAGTVRDIVIKPASSSLQYTWGAAVWRPAFTDYLHEFLAGARDDPVVLERLEAAAQSSEVYMGDVMRSALEEGIRVEAVVVSQQPYLDIGTPQNLRRAMRTLF